MAKSIQEINEKIREGRAVVCDAEEIIEVVRNKGVAKTAREVDVVTTGTFAPMCSSGAYFNVGHSNPRIKMGGGTVTLDLRSCRIEPGKAPEHGVAADMEVTLENLKLELGPSLRDLLGMIKVKTRVYEVARLPLHVAIRNGRIQADPVRMVIEQQSVIVGGWVAFDGAVNYVIEVPVTERLVGSAASRVLKGTSIKIPVTGTVDEPRLDTRALQNMLGNLLKNAVGEQAIERVGGFLDKLRQELSK